MQWAAGEPRVEFASEPLVVAKVGDVITTLQALCDAQLHDNPVLACTKILCVDRVGKFFEPDADGRPDVPS